MTQQDPRDGDQAFRESENLTTADLARGGPPQSDRPAIGPGEAPSEGSGNEPLFPANEANELRARWDSIQAGFVDEPRRAVEEADSLVAAAMKRLAETFAKEREQLESQWDRGGDVSTEDLRLALRRYRAFFGRLLSM